MSGQERRHNFRVATERAVVCYSVDESGFLRDPLPATTVDLSANGASVCLVDAVKLTGRVCIQLRLALPSLDLLVFGRAVRAPKPGISGIRFEGLTADARRHLTRFVFAEAKRLGQGDKPVQKADADGDDDSATHADEPTPTVVTPARPTRRNPGRLSVEEFASAIGQTVGSTRRLLGNGLVPGARRMDPTAKKSHWIIPPTAPEEYLALFRKQDAGAAAPAIALTRRRANAA